jgi:signal transduction histidine kinase
VADRSAVERIVHNLVDNAAKYAAGAEDPRVSVEASRDAAGVTIAVEDRGPGIAAPEATRVFRAFRKSAADAATSAPGIGLGLALGRGLARAMGGDLRLAPSGRGARLELRIPTRDG